MEMSFGYELAQCQSHEYLPCCGSIFPRVDEMLRNTECQKALEFVAYRKKMDNYRSMVDFLFCEIFTEFRSHCMKYYSGDGPQLSGHKKATEVAVDRWEHILVWALERAMEIMEEGNRVSWGWFQEEILKAA